MEPFCLHPPVFAWGDEASVKSHPEMCTSLRLLQEYLIDGFLTNTEPLHITELMVSAEQYNLGVHSIGYINGQARMTTLLCILSRVIDISVVPGMQQSLPKLYESSRTIWCYRFYFESKRASFFCELCHKCPRCHSSAPEHSHMGCFLKEVVNHRGSCSSPYHQGLECKRAANLATHWGEIHGCSQYSVLTWASL